MSEQFKCHYVGTGSNATMSEQFKCHYVGTVPKSNRKIIETE